MSDVKTSFFLFFLFTIFIRPSAAEDTPGASMTSGFEYSSGAELYQNICAGCHMPDGRGATTAGAYPSLKDNGRVAAADYVIYVVGYGQGGMPSFKGYLSDSQIASVVQFVRTNFGNAYEEPVSPEKVNKILAR